MQKIKPFYQDNCIIKENNMKLIYKIIVSVLLIVAVVVTIIFSLPRGGSAIRKMLSYIPGIDIVDTTFPSRALANPATDGREDFPATQSQAACISESDWAYALANPQPIPAELNGKILFEENNVKTSTNRLSFARLDGSEIHPLVENGRSASVSPDGSRVVYMGSDGVYAFNIKTGLGNLISGTSPNADVSPAAWSPDGQQFGFSDTIDGPSPKNIFLTSLDGYDPKLLTSNEPLKLMQGWMPDGRILYITLDENVPILKLIDPRNGETSSLFNVPELAPPIAFSKDGKRLAIDWLEQTTSKQILYVLTLDGTQRKPLLELTSDGYIRNMLWTPDGKWLLVDLSRNVTKEPYTKVLVQVDTCQIIPVLNLEGTVLDWLP